MKIYIYIVVIVLILGFIMPQRGIWKKHYIILMSIMHAFVCGFKYKYLHGDLRKMSAIMTDTSMHGWTSKDIVNGGRNIGFYWLMKFVNEITNDNFQVLLIIIAIITETAVAVLIYRYSSMPWMSYLIWNCLGFYIAGMYSIKQSLAMGILMFAMIQVLENRPVKFVILTVIAGLFHAPAFIFLPAYWIAKRKINYQSLIIYIFIAGLIFLFRNRIVDFMTDIYYDNSSEIENLISDSGFIGGRAVFIILLLVFGILLTGFSNQYFEKIFNIIVIAAILQMFSGFNNIFSRLADYYFQFSIIYIPMLFREPERYRKNNGRYILAVFPFTQRSLYVFAIIATIFFLWYYYTTSLNINISNAADNYLNFRFMWQVH